MQKNPTYQTFSKKNSKKIYFLLFVTFWRFFKTSPEGIWGNLRVIPVRDYRATPPPRA